LLQPVALLRMLFVPAAEEDAEKPGTVTCYRAVGRRSDRKSRHKPMSDTEKRIEHAEKALQKGKPDLAVAEYLAIIEDDPSNEPVYYTASDICVSLGRNSEAVKLLNDLFSRQCSRSDKPKAALTYKKLSRITRPTGEQSLTFAHSLAKNNEEALKAYDAALQVFADKSRKREALSALNGIVALAPSVEHFRQQGELAAELDLKPEAAAAYLAAGELEKDEDSKFVFLERAYKLHPQDFRMAMPHAEALLARGNPEKAALIIEPFTSEGDSQKEARSIYGRAMLAAKQPARAIRFLWEMFERDPAQLTLVTEAIIALAAGDEPATAIEWIRKLEQSELKAGRRREFINLIKSIATKYSLGLEFLEYMAGVFDAANREHDYCETLLKLFDLHYASGNFAKAAACLDRAAEVDAYESGHSARLEMLRGKVDTQQFNSVAMRLGAIVTSPLETVQPEEAEPEAERTVLDDLMTQAQIYFRYSMDGKALEKLKRIQKLFPGEEHNNTELHELYARAGILMRRTSDPGPEPIVDRPAPRATENRPAGTSVDDIGRVTEITTNLYRQTTVRNVLFACVNDAGRHWGASRCMAILCTPGKPPSIALEYCAPGVKQSDIHSIVKLVALLHPLTVAHGTLNLSNAKGAKPALKQLQKPIAAMGMHSLLAAPLVNGEDHVGLLLLAQCDTPREWLNEDVSVLNAIGEQVVLAVANARLRKLVRDLAVTEEKSGLVKRSSYMDVLLSEVSRGLLHNSPTSLMLINFGNPDTTSELAPDAAELMMRHIASLITSHVRQNDVAIRYDASTIALILADTNAESAAKAAEKLRKVAVVATIPGRDTPPQIGIGISEAVHQPSFDPADVVTEAVNRAEQSLSQALALGPNQTTMLAAPQHSSIARA
jgi:diguanylate cyclase (GGDEF)-like protein